MFDETNKRADVKYKDKAAFILITEFVGIRSNMYVRDKYRERRY